MEIQFNWKKLEPWHRGLVTDSQRVIAKKLIFLFWQAVFQAARPTATGWAKEWVVLFFEFVYVFGFVFSFAFVFVLLIFCGVLPGCSTRSPAQDGQISKLFCCLYLYLYLYLYLTLYFLLYLYLFYQFFVVYYQAARPEATGWPQNWGRNWSLVPP